MIYKCISDASICVIVFRLSLSPVESMSNTAVSGPEKINDLLRLSNRAKDGGDIRGIRSRGSSGNHVSVLLPASRSAVVAVPGKQYVALCRPNYYY